MSLLQTSLISPTLRIANNHPCLRNAVVRPFPSVVLSRKPDPPKPRTRSRRRKPEVPKEPEQSRSEAGEGPSANFRTPIARKPRRGRRSEGAAVEDYVRDRLERTFAAIREQNPELFEGGGTVLKERVVDDDGEEEAESESSDEDAKGVDDGDGGEAKKTKMVVEEECKDWPLDADIGWGIRASEYFEKHPIKNVVGDDGFEIDWEGEIDDNWVQEINCLEWESFAFHPSPLVVLVFERYNRATDNWKALKELEKAVKVYWDAKDRLPPRSVKIDINIERDLAYALKVKAGPQILFLRGNRILYREKEFRTADELVHLIAYFYYNAKRPSWIDVSALTQPY